MPLPDFKLPTAGDDHDAKLLTDIERVGWHVVHINSDEGGPAFTFSVGFYYTFQQPEILIMGLRHDVALSLLNIAVVQMAGGKTFKPFERVSSFAETYDCAFAPIEIEQYRDYLGYAIWFYRGLPQPFPALQLVWPDKQGRFPWEPDYDERFFSLQKKLYATP